MVPDVVVRRHQVTARVARSTAGDPDWRTAAGAPFAAALQDLPTSEGYWIIRSLEVRTRLGAGWSVPAMSGAMAAAVSSAVNAVTSRAVDTEQALWFPDRSAYLAQFLLDLADGRAADRWQYAGLADLGRRPQSALAYLAATESASLSDALLGLTTAELGHVVEQLAPDETEVLGLLGAAGTATDAAAIAAVMASLQPLLATGRASALVLAASSARDHDLPLTATGPAAIVVADVVPALLDPARSGRVASLKVAALREGRWAELAKISDSFLPLLSWPAELRSQLADAAANPRPSPAEPGHTDYGGAFLLAQLLDDLWDWSSATDSWPAPVRGSAAGSAQLLTVVAVIGRGRSLAPAGDPVLRELFAVTADLAELAQWLLAITPAQAAVLAPTGQTSPDVALPGSLSHSPAGLAIGRAASLLLRALARRLPGMAGASAGYLWHNVLDIDARVTRREHDRVVSLGHPPLAVLLAMSGLDRGSFVLRGQEVRWTLTSAD